MPVDHSVFRQRIRAALENQALQAALDANAERRLRARQEAFASLPQPWEVMRQRAHAVRAVVIANLDELLEQFIARAESNGMIVLRAEDAAQAIHLVLDITRQHGARRVAKSKTMVSEEIGLNHALEAAGMEVVETDLGEYIVQLRGERPAHIITPAVHLRRNEVGQTFHEKLGIELTEDIPTLTSAARVLRKVFLDADLGISGVNFGVVESGTLCIVTNEGNGRMVTTLPRVHIALMGMERLVPTLDDLALMLYLLPRSATGQKLSVYTSLIHGPAEAGEGNNPQARYLILVDNGRSALRHSPLEEALYCIRCGACLNACPVFREIGGHAYVNPHGESSPYPGPIGSVVSPGLFGMDDYGYLARASSLCGACKEVCPVNIDLPKLLLRIRAGEAGHVSRDVIPSAEQMAVSNAPRSLAAALRIFSWVAARPALYRIAQRMAGLLSRVVSPRSGWLRLPAFSGWGTSKDFPRPAARPFHARWRALQADRLPATSEEGLSISAKQENPPLSGEWLPSGNALIERFAQELTALGGVFVTTTGEELAGKILELLKNRGIDTVMAWADDRFPVNLVESLRQAGITITRDSDSKVHAGLTGATAAIAETGSILLCSSPGSPLPVSLLPETHIAVIHGEDIRWNVADVFGLQELRQASSAVLVSGPSRTADIEMTLTIGVHGPGEVIVFCLP